MNLEDFVETIRSKEDFDQFLLLLCDDYKRSENSDDKWENRSLERYLQSIQQATVSIENYYRFNKISFNPDKPGWKIFAEILLMAKVYE